MIIIVGLGNWGEEYKNNRHNAGFMFIDYIARKIQNSKFNMKNCSSLLRQGFGGQAKFKIEKNLSSQIIKFQLNNKKIVLAKPRTFMNNSGHAVKKLVTCFKFQVSPLRPSTVLGTSTGQASSMYIVHDDLDIRLGEFKIQKGKGPKLHNGIESIEKHLHTKNFWRVRIGVDNRNPQRRIAGETYVLQNFNKEELEVLNKTFVYAANSLWGKS